MKKLALCLAIVAAVMMVPFSAFGLQMMDDNSMDQITGQAGVSIAMDDVQIFMNVDRFTYIDPDGIGFLGGWSPTATTNEHGAAFNVNQFQIDTLKINAFIRDAGTVTGTIGNSTVTAYDLAGINDKTKFLGYTSLGYAGAPGTIPLQYNYGSVAAFTAQTSADLQSVGLNHLYDSTHIDFFLQAITIDVSDAAPILSQGADTINTLTGGSILSGQTNIAAVIINLPTAEFYIDNLNIGSMTLTDNVVVGVTAPPVDASKSFNHNQSYGSIEIQGITFAILNGWVEIAPNHE